MTRRKQAIQCLVILLVTIASLRWMGRVWWCACGGWSPWSWDIWSRHNSQHLIDPYFFTHVLHGIGFYAVFAVVGKTLSVRGRFQIIFLLEAVWEIAENSPWIIDRYREATIALDYCGDSVANALFDILACAAGFLIAARIPVSASVAMFVLTELILTLTIRDCLTLNVLMLLCPLEAVRQWQMSVP
ncbi:MAG: DUF2585 family protein [Planctomycetaceae bacterium]